MMILLLKNGDFMTAGDVLVEAEDAIAQVKITYFVLANS